MSEGEVFIAPLFHIPERYKTGKTFHIQSVICQLIHHDVLAVPYSGVHTTALDLDWLDAELKDEENTQAYYDSL